MSRARLGPERERDRATRPKSATWRRGGPEPQHLAAPRDVRDREPRRRPRRPARVGDARRWPTGPGRDVLDLGCGTGFHLPRFAATAALGARASSRTRPAARWPARRTPRARRTSRVLAGHRPGAARSPTRRSTWCTRGGPTSSGPAASPGCAELARVVRRGRHGVRDRQRRDPVDVRRRGSGAATPTSTRRRSSGSGRARAGPGCRSTSLALRQPGRPRGRGPDRARPPRSPTRSSPSTQGTEVDYAVNLWWRRF